MNLRILLLFSILACSYIKIGHAEEFDIFSTQQLEGHPMRAAIVKKVYVEPSQIYLSNNQILVQTPHGMIGISKLISDEEGIHYEIVHPYSWDCTRCGNYNAYTYYCEECKYSPWGELDPEDD